MHLRLGVSSVDAQAGLFGQLKRFTLYEEMLEDENSLKNLAFDQLYPATNPKLLISLPLDGTSPYRGLLEHVNMISFEPFPEGASPVQVADELPSWLCHRQDPADFKTYFRFQSLQNQLKQETFSRTIYNSETSTTL